jgi:hypothetical protein
LKKREKERERERHVKFHHQRNIWAGGMDFEEL